MQGEALESQEADATEPDPNTPEGTRLGPTGTEPRHLDPKELADRLMLAKAETKANAERLSQSRERLTEVRNRSQAQRTLREASHDSAYARLLARFQSQPVIEQAKGMLMAESHCSADQAFEILRKASQRENVPVREIAARIVGRAVPPPSRWSLGSLTAPSSPRGPRCPRSRRRTGPEPRWADPIPGS